MTMISKLEHYLNEVHYELGAISTVEKAEIITEIKLDAEKMKEMPDTMEEREEELK